MHPKSVALPSPPAQEQLFLFGTPRLATTGDHPPLVLEWRGDAALLCLVASRRGWQSREGLAQLVRPNVPAANAKSYLRGLLHRLRTQMPGLSCLEVQADRVRWTGRCDVCDFDQAIEAMDWQAAIDLHADTLANNVGPCGILAIDDWYFDERVRIEKRLQTALRAEIVRLRSPLVDSARLMQQLVRDEWLDETTLRFLLSHAETPSERHLVTAAYTRHVQALSDEAGQQPGPDLQIAYRSMLSQPAAQSLASSNAGPMATPSQPHADKPFAEYPVTLPTAPPTPVPGPHLLGRERELQTLSRLIADPEIRLINIHGLGGVGKSRLARDLFQRMTLQTPAEAAWMALQDADVATEGLLPVLRQQLGQPASEADTSDDWIQHRLTGGPQVLFLDGLDATLSSQQALRKLLAVSRELRLVVTSRMALGLAEEHRVTLRGLDYHGLDAPASQLFLEQAARFGADVGSMNAATIGRITAHLEGIPLAIELAASWTMLLSVQDIQAQLEKNASLLDSGLSANGERTMAAVVRNIWAALTATEQAALTGVVVHTGPLAFEAALILADTEPRVLLSLANYALLQRDDSGSLRIPLLLRQLIVATADPDGLRAARGRHARYYLERLAQSPAVKLGQTPRERLIAIRRIFDEVVVAWRWALESGAIDLLSAATENMLGFLFAESRFELARDLAACTAEQLPVQHPLHPVYCAFHALAAFRLGRMEEAAAATQKGLQAQPQGSALALLSLAASRLDRFYGRHQSALAHAQAALAAAENSDGFIRLRVREDYAVCHLTFGNIDSATRVLRLNLAAARELAAPFVEGRALILLGSADDAEGAHQEALKYYDKALAVFHALDDGYQIAYCHRLASYAHANLGNSDLQLREAQLSLQGFRHGAHVHELSEGLYALAMAQHRSGDVAAALTNGKEALGMALRFQRTPSALRCIWALGMMLLPTHREVAMTAMRFAIDHPALRQIDKAYIERHLGRMDTALEERGPVSANRPPLDLSGVIQLLLSTDLRTAWGPALTHVP